MVDGLDWNAGRFRVPAGELEAWEGANRGGTAGGCSPESLGGFEDRADEEDTDDDEGAWRGEAIAAPEEKI